VAMIFYDENHKLAKLTRREEQLTRELVTLKYKLERAGVIDVDICRKCRKRLEPDEPDPCLGLLPGVEYACCGHGVFRGYIRFLNGTTIRFGDATVDGCVYFGLVPEEK